jgi:hypothetical protein
MRSRRTWALWSFVLRMRCRTLPILLDPSFLLLLYIHPLDCMCGSSADEVGALLWVVGFRDRGSTPRLDKVGSTIDGTKRVDKATKVEPAITLKAHQTHHLTWIQTQSHLGRGYSTKHG